MSAPPRKAGTPRLRSSADRRGTQRRPEAVSRGAANLVPVPQQAMRHHHDADEAASAAAAAAALIGPFVLLGAVALRVLRHLARHAR